MSDATEHAEMTTATTPVVAQLPGDDVLVWTAERRRNMQVHWQRPVDSTVVGELLTWADARRAYKARLCWVCWATATTTDRTEDPNVAQ